MPPGCTQETEMLEPSSSCRNTSVKPRTANLLAEYALCPTGATNPKTLETFTMCARGCRFSTGKKYVTPYTTPQKLMFISQRKSSREISSNCPSSATPALFISRVTHRRHATTSSDNARTDVSTESSYR